VSRAAKSVIAIVAACCVLTVLITPAPDELPSTAAQNHLYSVASVMFAVIPLGVPPASISVNLASKRAATLPGIDLLAQTCSLLI